MKRSWPTFKLHTSHLHEENDEIPVLVHVYQPRRPECQAETHTRPPYWVHGVNKSSERNVKCGSVINVN
jgi:hypothetical protein